MTAIIYDGRYIAYDSDSVGNKSFTMQVTESDFLNQKSIIAISGKIKAYNELMELLTNPKNTLVDIDNFFFKLKTQLHALVMPLDGNFYYEFNNAKKMRKRSKTTHYCFASNNVDDLFGYCVAKYKKNFALKVLQMAEIAQRSNLIDFDVKPPFITIDTQGDSL